jgi:hypothetical protein
VRNVNKKIILLSAAMLALFGASVGAQSTCIPTSGGPYCPISQQASFQQTYIGTQQNNIAIGGYLSDSAAWLAANWLTLFLLAIGLAVLAKIGFFAWVAKL